ncbi:MAG: hypothetical protein IT450_06510 [Phycisphaerales bacterium]|nr:hypothetical protein [Phycisphaerales bacterium]
MSDGNWYNCKLVIGDDPGNSALQQLRFWVDLNNNGSFELGEKVAETTVVDDDWSAGYVGLFRGSDGTNVARFDDFKVGFDNSGPEDNDFDDGGDEIAIDDNFNSAATSLVYDNNGNCTDDGVFKYVYDAWNRLVGAKHRSAANATTVATYEYSGSHSRMTHVITNTGVENELGDGGERTSVFYYAQGRLAEERNGSAQLVRAYAWGSGGAGVPAGDLLWVELNGDVTIGDDSNPDNAATGEGSESPADARYFAHADRSGGIAALTEYDTGGTNNGRVVERSIHNTERRIVFMGDLGTGEIGSRSASSHYEPHRLQPVTRHNPVKLTPNAHLDIDEDMLPFGTRSSEGRSAPTGPDSSGVSGCNSDCCLRWHSSYVVIRPFRHIGLDIYLRNRTAPNRFVDYGARNSDCGSWSIFRYPDTQDFATMRGSFYFEFPVDVCEKLLVSTSTDHVPLHWGACGNYRLLGPNSNSGIKAARRWVQDNLNRYIPRPPEDWIRMAPGWQSSFDYVYDSPRWDCCEGYGAVVSDCGCP